MNSWGTPIVNGLYRIVISQILQSPISITGQYWTVTKFRSTGTIIFDWGGRLELKIDRETKVRVRVSRKQKISILVLSSAMGSNLKRNSRECF